MNELEIALFTVIIGAIRACIGAGAGFAFMFGQRLRAVEVIVDLMFDKARDILHSPHTPELDAYIELDAEGKLTIDQVPDFIRLLKEVETDRNEPKGNRLAAALTHIKICKQFKLDIPSFNNDFLLRSKRRVLIVEDDPRDREIALNIFNDADLVKKFEVDTATTGREAIERLVREDYDIIFLDLKLPVMDGIGVLEYCKKNASKIPIFLVTAYPDDALISQIPIMSVIQIVRKQLTKEKVIEILRKQKLLL